MAKKSLAGRRIVVVGGGISGLAAAHRLTELSPAVEIVLFEATDRLGGILDTRTVGGYLIERSADSFITDVPWAVDLCRRIGLADDLVHTDDRFRRAWVVRHGRLHRIPDGFSLMAPARLWPLATTPLLSPWGKLRILAEYFIPKREASGDESLASFVRRRLGREALDRLVQPLVGGIYTADPEKLSLAATMPRFLEMERQHGGLIRGARRLPRAPNGEHAASGARYSLFVAPQEGLSSLVERLAARLPQGAIRLRAPVQSIARNGTRWTCTAGGDAPLECDAVILCVPAPKAAELMSGIDAEASTLLGKIPYASAVVVSLAYRREDITKVLDSFGLVAPLAEGRRILAASFASIKFAGRAPADQVLIRVFIGGACQGELADLSDERLQAIAAEELAELLGIRGQPALCDIARWPRSMPQYHVGHVELVAAIDTRIAEVPHLALAGNAYHGVGIPHCIQSGEEAAERIIASLT